MTRNVLSNDLFNHSVQIQLKLAYYKNKNKMVTAKPRKKVYESWGSNWDHQYSKL